MRFYTVRDFVTFKKLHNKINSLQPEFQTPPLRRLKTCMQRVNPSGVAIIKRGNKVNFTGVRYCRSWCCPACAPYRASKVKKNLDLAFKMLENQNYKCLMVTYTVPHANSYRFSSDVDTTDEMHLAEILYLLQKTFNKYLNSGSWRKYRGADFYSFSTYEINWGYNHGWHPHIHALYWIRPENFDILDKVEAKLVEIWKRCILKIVPEISWISKEKQNWWIQYINNAVGNSRHKGVYISRNDDNSIREITGGNYFWSGIAEVGDLLKKTGRKEGHFTQWEILSNALNESAESNKFFSLYQEIMTAVAGLQQYRFKQGFLQEIKEFAKKLSPYEKKTEVSEGCKIVCWLSPKQWNYLKYVNRCYYLEIILSSFALCDDAFELIKELCEVFKVDPPLKEVPFELKLAELQTA